MEAYNSSNGKLLHISQNITSKYKPKISLTRNEYDFNSCTFLICESFDFQCPTPQAQSKCITFCSCEETLTDIKISALLIENINGKTIDYYIIAFSPKRSQFTPLRKLQLTKKLLVFKLVDGPTIVWIEDESLYIGTSSSHNQCRLLIFTVAGNLQEAKLIEVKQHMGYYAVVGKHKTNEDTISLFFYVLVPSQQMFGTYTVKECDVGTIVSPLYTNISGLIFEDVNISIKCDNLNIESSVLAVTEEGYILNFIDGQLVFAVQTNSHLVLDVHIFYFQCIPVQQKYLGIFSEDEVRIFSIEKREVVHSWSGIKEVLCDDFVNNGGHQLLVLTEGFDGKSGFILTDVDIVHTDTTSGNVQRESESDRTNTTAAVTALQSRLRNEVVSLNELTSDVHHRKQHIAELWSKSAKLNQGTSVDCVQNPMLVSLIGNDDNELTTVLHDEETSSIKFRAVWKRIHEKILVVGVELTNTSKSSKVVSMVMVPTGQGSKQVMTFTSACFDLGKLTATKNIFFNASKRRKVLSTSISNFEGCETYQLESGHSAVLLCKTDVPSFTTIPEINFTISVHIIETADNCVNKINEILHAGETTLSALDVVEGKYDIELNTCSKIHPFQPTELQRDVLTLNFVQVLMLMLVKSTRFPLSQLSLWLQKKAGAVWVEEYDCMVFECKPVLKGTRLYLDNSSGTSKDVKMKIYTSGKDQLCLLLQHLYTVLPDDVIFVPANEDHCYINQLLNSMQYEISKTFSAVQEMFNKVQPPEEDESVECEKDEKGQINIDNVRKNFAKRTFLSKARSKLFAAGEDSANVCQDIENLQIRTDTEFIKFVSDSSTK